MVDFWEMMGRLVTDTKFRKAVFAMPLKKYPQANLRITIGVEDYGTLRQILGDFSFTKNMPISLMALGEMLYSITFSDFRSQACGIADAIKAMGLPRPQSESFYVALGALITDPNLVTELCANDGWQTWGFGTVKSKDRSSLKAIVDKDRNPVLASKIYDFCYLLWGSDCWDSCVAWPAHQHPVVPQTKGKKR